MTRKSYAKKTLSILLAVLMCLSVCILDWSALMPQSNAATAGSYKVRIFADVSNGAKLDGSDMRLYYKDKNGTGTSNYYQFKSGSDGSGDWYDDGGDASYEFTVNGFPDYMYLNYKIASGLRQLEFTIYLYVWNYNTNSWVELTRNSYSDKSDLTESKSFTRNTSTTSKPSASAVVWDSTSTLTGTVPLSGTATIGTGTAKVKDQYGVNWYADPSFSIHSNTTTYNSNQTVATGISLASTGACASTNINVTNAAKDWVSNSSDGTTYQRSFYINAYYGSIKSGNKTVTLTNCKYSFTLNGSVSPSYPTSYSTVSNFSTYGTADVANRGTAVLNDGSTLSSSYYYGTSYSVSDIKAKTGYVYEGVASGSTSGKITAATTVTLKFRIANSTLAVNPNSGTWNSSTSTTNNRQQYNSTLSVPVPTKSGWTFTGWTKSSTFYGTLSSTTAAGTYTFPSNDGVTSTITAKWKRDITNTYHWLKADATTDQSTTVSGTAYDTATTLALTAPAASSVPATVAKNDKTWTFMGWKEASSTTWGGASATADVTAGASHNVATTSSAHTFYPVYALKTTKFYANYNYYNDNATAYSKITKNTTVNGDAATGTMAVATVSDTGAGAEIARYYNKNGRIYELQGWALTEGATTATIPYTATTTTLNVPGAGTPTSTANTTPIELYPVYTLYGTAITARYYYWNANGTAEEYREASGMAVGSATAGTLTMPGADQVVSSYTKNGVTYTLKGWTKVSNADTNYIAFGGTQSAAVLADPASDYYTYYPVYECSAKSIYHYFRANGSQDTITETGTAFKTDANTPTTVDVAVTTGQNSGLMIDGRVFMFAGWRKDTTSAAPTVVDVASENHAITDTAYHYYAIYTNEDLALGYDTTHDGITATPVPETQKGSQYINAGLTSSADNTTAVTFTVGPNGLVPAKKGYTFIGWARTDSEAETAEIPNGGSITVKINTTLYARFKVNKMNVTFVYYDGSDLEGGYANVTKTVSYDDLLRDDSATNTRYVVTAPTVQKKLSDNIVSSKNIAHANDKYHYVFREWVRSDGKGVNNVTTSGVNYTANFKNVTEDITIQARYDAYSHHYYELTTADLAENGVTADPTAARDATCTEDGYQYLKCADCGHVYKKILPAFNHMDAEGNDVKTFSGYKAPGCTTTGKYATAACALCGNTVRNNGEIQYYDVVNNAFVEVDSADGIIPATDHNYKYSETVDPTCTERGYDIWVCANNELHTEKRNYTAAIGHTEETTPEVPATCTTDGLSEKIVCSVCNSVVIDSFIIPATGHTLVKTDAEEPTCTEAGNIEYYTCSVCNKVYTDKYATNDVALADTVIAALEHDFVDMPAEPATCDKDGHTAGIVCSRCGEIAPGSDAVVTEPAKGHDLDDGVHTPSTKPCEEAGYTTYSCSRCDYTEVEYDDIAEHTENIIAEKPATCTTLGKTSYTECEVCGKILTNFKWIPKTAHDYTTEVTSEVPATCVADGTTAVLKCSVCGDQIGGDVIPSTGHSYTSWIITKKATCTEDGSKERLCKVCDTTETEVITAAGHTVVEVAETAATCDKEGVTAGTKCSVCGEILSGCVVIPMLEHNMGTPETIREATCALEGLKVTKCADCDYQIVETIAKTVHTPETTKEAVEATCTSAGKTAEIVCSVCGEVISAQKNITKLDHTYVTVDAVAPTCTEKGATSYQKCSVCDFELTTPREVNALGHSFGEWQLVKAPTCTNAGMRVRYCTVEGCEAATDIENYDVQTKILPALGHNMTKTEAKAPACGVNGNVEYYTCSRCEGKYFKNEAGTATYSAAEITIDALTHSWGNPDVVNATCTAGGYTVETCGYCGETRKVNETEALGHTGGQATCVEKAVCEVCGVHYGNLANHVYNTTAVEGTCIERGYTTKTCIYCGKTSTSMGSFGTHSEEIQITKESTCTQEGEYIIYCSICREVLSVVTFEADGHEDANNDGTCDVCGADLGSESGEGTSSDCTCGMNHGSKTGGLFGQNGILCKIITFFKKLFGIIK